MIYCVVPEELADELYPKLAKYYEDDPNVKVIIDRRKAERRAGEDRRDRDGRDDDGAPRRATRDRRRRRLGGRAARRDPRSARPAGGGRLSARRPRRVKVTIHVDGGSRGNPG